MLEISGGIGGIPFQSCHYCILYMEPALLGELVRESVAEMSRRYG